MWHIPGPSFQVIKPKEKLNRREKRLKIIKDDKSPLKKIKIIYFVFLV
jgi:hypothetical protein